MRQPLPLMNSPCSFTEWIIGSGNELSSNCPSRQRRLHRGRGLTLSSDDTLHPFPWTEEESAYGHRIQRPTLEVQLSANGMSISTKALIDTGAPRCVFPRGVGDLLAVEFADPTKKITLMGNTWSAVTVSVSLVLGPFPDTCWDAEVDFVTDGNLPFALLGYEGFQSLGCWL